MDEITASLALRHTRGLGARTWKRLVTAYGTAQAAAEDWRHWAERRLASAAVAQSFGAAAWREAVQAEMQAARRLSARIVPWSDAAYPPLLRAIADPPILLYIQGRPELLSGPCVAVVGSRRPSRYGTDVAHAISRDLARAGVCVVSGLAVGIDRAAHQGALPEVGSSCAVLGTGMDLVYPAGHRELWQRLAQDGVLVTEFAPGTRPEGRNFPYRNRIISGMSLGVVVIEAALRSGTAVTAALALTQGREVFVVPGPVTAETFHGSHQLLRDGATLVQSGADVLRELTEPLRRYAGDPSVRTPEPEAVPLSPAPPSASPPPAFPSEDARAVWQCLHPEEARHVDAVAQTLGWDAGRVSAALLLLEMEGLVRQTPGMYYTALRG